jgi:hypothetical protein
MRYQNLTDGLLATWRHGRAWAGKWHFEWTVFHHPGVSIGIRKGGYSDNEILFNLHLLVFGIYISREFHRSFEERELSLDWHHGYFWIKLWTDDAFIMTSLGTGNVQYVCTSKIG